MSIICSKRFGTMLAISFIAAFLILSLARDYDFKTFESISSSIGDDWGTYANHALDIVHNGLLMPSTRATYCSPSGFLYNYFIAACLVIFGQRSLPIFVVQHLMLGLSVALVYWTFRDKMRGLTGLAFLCALFYFALKDVYKNYSPLLLSENLALFTVSLFFFCFVKGFEKKSLLLQLASAILLGMSILTRPNIFVFALALIPAVTSYYIRKGKGGFADLLIFAFVLVSSSSFLFARNYLLLREVAFLPSHMSSLAGLSLFHPIPASVDLSRAASNPLYAHLHINKYIVGYIEYVIQQPYLFAVFYVKKIMFCLGYLPALSSAHGIRWHWLIMWAGYFTYLLLRAGERRRWEMWEMAAHLYIFCYYGSLILTTYVHNYGFRMLIPAVFFVLAFAFMAVDKLWSAAICQTDNADIPR